MVAVSSGNTVLINRKQLEEPKQLESNGESNTGMNLDN